MKKFIAILLTCVMVLGMTACAPGGATGTKAPSDKTTSDNKPVGDAPDETAPSEQPAKLQTVYIPAKGICVDCDLRYTLRSEGCATLMYTSNDALLALCRYTSREYTGDLNGVFDIFKKKLPNDASTHSRGDLWGCEIEMLSSENVMVNGFEGIRFTGKIPNKSGWDCHVYGYLFLINKIPCGVAGLVSAEAQDSAMIQQINAEVETIVATIRTTK